MAETKTAETKRMKLEIIEVKERQPIGDRGAVKLSFKAKIEDKELWFFTFSTRLFETIEAGKGQTLEVDVVISTREYDGNTYIDRKVTQIYKDGQPIAVSSGGRQYGKSPEELQLSRRSFALSYAKDLAVAKLIEVKDILTKAENYYRWMGEGTISTALKTTPKDTVKKTTTAVKPTTPDTEQAELDSKELWPEGGSEGLSAEESKGEVPKTQEQLFNYVAKHAGHKDTKFTKAYLINKFKIPEKRIDEDIVSVYYEVKALNDWPDYDGE